MGEQVKGPRSSCPSIEKTYGQPVERWMTQLDAVRHESHMMQVAFLKEQHGLGHGHANARVAVCGSERSAAGDDR